MKQTLKKIRVMVLCFVLALMGFAGILFRNELRSLSSIRQLDSYGMFQMTYLGDYGFDEFLTQGAQSDQDIEAFVTRRLLKGIPLDLGVVGDGCTAFVVRNEQGDILFGRNFDFSYAPSMQVFTNPKNGYASVSTVKLSFAGYGESLLPSGLNSESFLSLAAPYLPFDGMNEMGVAIALLAVPEANPPHDPDRITLNTTTAIRLVLDKAANVGEAVALLQKYNIYFSGGIDCHYLIADATGTSAIVEYYDGDLRVTTAEQEYQIASNFIVYNNLNIGEGFDEFDRYNRVQAAIEQNGGRLGAEQAFALLADVGVRDGGTDKLQWTVVYNLTAGNGSISAHRNTVNVVDFHLKEQ